MYLLDSSQSLSSSDESSESCSPSLLCSSSLLIGTRLKSSAWDKESQLYHVAAPIAVIEQGWPYVSSPSCHLQEIPATVFYYWMKMAIHMVACIPLWFSIVSHGCKKTIKRYGLEDHKCANVWSRFECVKNNCSDLQKMLNEHKRIKFG